MSKILIEVDYFVVMQWLKAIKFWYHYRDKDKFDHGIERLEEIIRQRKDIGVMVNE